MPAFAGGVADPGQYNEDIKKLVAYGQRTSSSTATTTEQEVLRLDGVDLKSGKRYEFKTNTVQPVSSIANDYVAIKLRYVTGGATATSSSTALVVSQLRITGASGNETTQAVVTYAPSGGDEELSLILTVARVSGTGNVSITGASTNPIELMVIDLGPDPGNTGMSL